MIHNDSRYASPKPPKPGCREDNEWLQYKSMSDRELEAYWRQPFTIKPWFGFHGYTDPVTLRVASAEGEPLEYGPIQQLLIDKFTDDNYLDTLLHLSTLEGKDGRKEN